MVRYLLFVSMCFPLISACSAPENSSASYNRSEMNVAQRTVKAKIVSKRSVTVSGASGVGETAGAATGYIAGSTMGDSGAENAIGAVIGTVVGATVGTAIENQAQSVEATEYILESDVTGLLTIIMTDASFPKGAFVYVSLGSPPKIMSVAE